jgi:hypothetical protein
LRYEAKLILISEAAYCLDNSSIIKFTFNQITVLFGDNCRIYFSIANALLNEEKSPDLPPTKNGGERARPRGFALVFGTWRLCSHCRWHAEQHLAVPMAKFNDKQAPLKHFTALRARRCSTRHPNVL